MPTKQRRNHASSANAVKQKQALEHLQDSSPAASVKLRRSSRHSTRDQDETDERVSIAMTLAGLADHMKDTCIAANKDVDTSNGCKTTITGSHLAADEAQQDSTDLVRVLPAILQRKSDDHPKSPTVASSPNDSRHNVKEKLIKKLSKDKEALNRPHVSMGSGPTTDAVPAESADMHDKSSNVTGEKRSAAAKLNRRNPKKKGLSTIAVSSTSESLASNKHMDSVVLNGDLPDRTGVTVSVASSAASSLELPSSTHDVGLMPVPVVLVPVLMPGGQAIQFMAANTNLMSNVFGNQTFSDGTAGFTAIRPPQLIGNSTFTVSGVSSNAVQSAGATFVASSLMPSQQCINRPPISMSNISLTPGVAKFIRTSSSLVSVPAVTPTTPISVTLPGSLNSIQQSYRNSLPNTNSLRLIKLETAPNDSKSQMNEDIRPESHLPATVCNEIASSVQSAAPVAENKPAVDTTAGNHQEQSSVQTNLGSLQSLREFYSSIQRKDQSSNTNVILVASHQNNSVVSVTGAQGSQPLINNITSTLDHCVINTGFAGNVFVSANNASLGSIRVLPQLKTTLVNSITVPQLSTVVSSLPSTPSDATNCLLSAATAGDEATQNHKRTAVDDSASVLPSKKRPRRSAKEKRIKNNNTGNESTGMCGSNNSGSNISTEPAKLAADDMCQPLVKTTSMNCVAGRNVVNCSQSSLPQGVTSSSSNHVVSHPVLQPDEDGDYPLHIAVVQCNLPLVQHILSVMKELTSAVDFYNDLRQTPLHLASYMNDARIVRALLDAGASPNCPDRRGLNCFHTAVERNNVECLRELLTHGHSSVCIDAMNYEGLTPLHIAVQHNSVEIVELLLSAGANVNVVDGKSGHSPLYLAAQLNFVEIARLLLQTGANVQLGSYYGCTPVQAASARANHAMVKLLQLNGAIDTSTSDKVRVDPNESSGQKVRQKVSRRSSVAAASASHSRASSPGDETAALEPRTPV